MSHQQNALAAQVAAQLRVLQQQQQQLYQQQQMIQQQGQAAALASTQYPKAGHQQPSVGSHQPKAGLQQPQTCSQQPRAGFQQPKASFQQPQAGSQQPKAGVQQHNRYGVANTTLSRPGPYTTNQLASNASASGVNRHGPPGTTGVSQFARPVGASSSQPADLTTAQTSRSTAVPSVQVSELQKKSNEISMLYEKYWAATNATTAEQKKLQVAQKELQDAKAELDEVRKFSTYWENETKEKEQSLQALEADMQLARKSRVHKAAADAEFTSLRAALQRSNELAQGRLDDLRKARDELRSADERLREAWARARNDVELVKLTHEQRRTDLADESLVLGEQVKTLEASVKHEGERADRFEAEVKVLAAQQTELSKKHKAELEAVAAKMDRTETVNSLTSALEEATKQNKDLKIKLSDEIAEKEKLRSEIASNRGELEAIEEEYNKQTVELMAHLDHLAMQSQLLEEKRREDDELRRSHLAQEGVVYCSSNSDEENVLSPLTRDEEAQLRAGAPCGNVSGDLFGDSDEPIVITSTSDDEAVLPGLVYAGSGETAAVSSSS
ncbi:unnamed protein product [Amoebophrya sp. A25]|nr:unnamed protein product [Amoebophrya sp. A25]|eukprot:GSA25T00001906001.1